MSGPSGFLGKVVIQSIVELHRYRRTHGLEPGELILLSSSPGHLMARLHGEYSFEEMKSIRGSRVDYFNQITTSMWVDHLGSLGLGGEGCVFINLAAAAGPVDGIPDAMEKANYHAPVAAARAAHFLHFDHFIQSSTQATMIERAGQVPYSRWKGMCDYALSRLAISDNADGSHGLNVTICRLGLLYSRRDSCLGQEREDESSFSAKRSRGLPGGSSLNLADLSLLPLTPILGSGKAIMQPQEVNDAARRVAWLSLLPPGERPLASACCDGNSYEQRKASKLRIYDAVGPESLSILELLHKFSVFQGSRSFTPVFIDYRCMEEVLNVKSLGNLNRQFVSILRSEQDGLSVPSRPSPSHWADLLSTPTSPQVHVHGSRQLKSQPESVSGSLITLEEAFGANNDQSMRFPYYITLLHILRNPRVILPGMKLAREILESWWEQWGEEAAVNELVELHFPSKKSSVSKPMIHRAPERSHQVDK